MQHSLVLLVALAAPLAALAVLRINAAMVFLSLCLGYVLVNMVADNSDSLIKFLAPNVNSVGGVSWRLVTLFAPAVLTSVFMVFSVHGKMKGLLNLLPAAATSMLALILAIPMLTPGLRSSLESSPFWQKVSKAEVLIVGAGAIIALFFLWTQRRGAKKSE